MNQQQKATMDIERLLSYAVEKALIDPLDRPYCRNLLLDLLGMDAPAEDAEADAACPVPETATGILADLCSDAVARGLLEDLPVRRDLFSARLMGAVTPSPAEVRKRFASLLEQQGPESATDDFYQLCRNCDYIKVDAIAQNIRYFSVTRVGELEITINLSKPEKDPREIARLKNAPSVGYPRCMLCVENPGYAGRDNFPARQNHRIVPLELAGSPWYLQYSPYAYYPEHCIVFNQEHVPMKIDRGTFMRLFDFVQQFPHYMLGSNADLPIVGGSILNHDHFQGGRYHFPMDKAPDRIRLRCRTAGVHAAVMDWPMSALRLSGRDPDSLIAEASDILDAWRCWSDPTCDIFAETNGTPHNTITPILRRTEDGTYLLTLVLRNNRTSEEHPLGIFHPHAPLHHIKRENIGLIEVMGLFILPGRLKTELTALVPYLTGELPISGVEACESTARHLPWLQEIISRRGCARDHAEALQILRSEVGEVCAQVLCDAGVYKQTESGMAGMLRFLASVNYLPA